MFLLSSRSASSSVATTTVVLVVTCLLLLGWHRVAAHTDTEGIRGRHNTSTSSKTHHRPQERSATTGQENTICRPATVDGANTRLPQEDHPDRMTSFPGWEGPLPSAWYSGCTCCVALRCVCGVLDKNICARRSGVVYSCFDRKAVANLSSHTLTQLYLFFLFFFPLT